MNAADHVRRARDIVVAVVVLVVLSPLTLAVAVLVRIDLGRPVIFRQQRLGRAGEPFEMLKFRTMRHAEPGRETSRYDADRLTAVGRFLRTSSLDELPSFINVLRGDLTLVGPRPLPTKYWDRFVGDEYRRFEVRPGITGLAQVEGRNQIPWNERLALDVRYVDARSLVLDGWILLRTIPLVLSGRAVNEQPASGATVTSETMTELPIDRSSPHRRSEPAGRPETRAET